MFKKLKEKITEEVKQSPQRFEQLSKGFQAAVSSASSTTSEVSGNENFFSITEDDTPQNSPLRKSQTGNSTSTPIPSTVNNNTLVNNSAPSTGAPSSASSSNNLSGSSFFANLSNTSANAVNSNNNGVSPSMNRIRRLSNSSMASDVSFRLPAYDSPAIYHLETDIDVSASETESVSGAVTSNGQLDLVSKEKLFQAYKKALDRYQKYRERYTELARRYRELEKDNTKARSVLVETQDKALRRISELREQCTLEQQAKAHLDSALRMEIDELQCVVKTLKSKLQAAGENPDEKIAKKDVADLISLAPDDSSNAELEEKLRTLEAKLADELKAKDALDQEVLLLKKREEENTITIAENKMAIHSELESKESEVRKLKEQLQSIEKNMKQALVDKDCLGKEISELKGKLNSSEKIAARAKELENTISTCNEQKSKLESKFVEFERKILEFEKERQRLKATTQTLENENEQLSKKLAESDEKATKLAKESQELNYKIAELEKISQNLVPAQEIDTLNGQIQALCVHRDELQRTFAASLTELDEYRCKNAENEKSAQEAKLSLEALKESLCQKESTIESLQSQLQQQASELNSKLEHLQTELELKSKHSIEQEDEIVRLKKTISLDQERLLEVTKALEALREVHDRDRASNEASMKEVFDQNNHLTAELKQFKDKLEKVNSKFKKIADEKGNLKTHNEQLQTDIKSCKQEVNSLQQQKAALAEEIRNLKIINEHSESEALASLQDSMRASLAQAEERLLETTRDLNHVIELKSDENRKLSEEREEIAERLEGAQKEKEDFAAEVVNLKSKIESLRNEKKDLEKTLEREIREKTELKAQVTNILQEIGRLEEQLKEVKTSHSVILVEKQTLEEKIERLQRQHTEAKSKADKEIAHKWQTKAKESEAKLQTVECENSQLAEKNCLLEENNRRNAEEIKKLQNSLQEAEVAIKSEKKKTKESTANLEEWKLKCQELEDKVKTTVDQLNQCTGDHAKLFNEKELLDHQHRSLQDEMEAKEKEKLCVLDNNQCLTEELTAARNTVQSMEEEKQKLTEECDVLKLDIEKVRLENEFLKGKQHELRAKLEEEKQIIQQQNDALNKEIDSMKNSNQNRLLELETLIKKANEEKQSFSKNATDLEKKLENYEEIKIENEYLNTLIKQLEGEIHSVKDERSKLQASVSAKDTELASLKLKVGQNEQIVEEKDQEIKKLINEFVSKEQELKAKILTLEHGKTQAEKNLTEANEKADSNLQVEKQKNNELEEQLETAVKAQQQLQTELEQMKTELTEGRSDSEQECRKLQTLLDASSEENKTLAGELQNVQKLKLENENFARDLEELKSELSAAMAEKLQLMETHSTLTAENDQLRQQQEPSDDREERSRAFDELRNKKEELENKLKKIMHEVQDVSNRNLFLEQKCENYLILEQSNERLKLQNEKLSRQLDETLVSMHHNEGIAANTEFEYLRNILFQYLSGNVNGNNSTLVKVIAAVLKFTPQQTQVVLEKEAHRRSLMGQINNLL